MPSVAARKARRRIVPCCGFDCARVVLIDTPMRITLVVNNVVGYRRDDGVRPCGPRQRLSPSKLDDGGFEASFSKLGLDALHLVLIVVRSKAHAKANDFVRQK